MGWLPQTFMVRFRPTPKGMKWLEGLWPWGLREADVVLTGAACGGAVGQDVGGGGTVVV